MVLINFRLKVNGRVLAWKPVLISFMGAIPGVELVGVADRNIEPTLVMRAERAPDKGWANKVCYRYRQDCFAVYDVEAKKGEIMGPDAKNRGPFNPAHFVVDGGGSRLSEVK